MTLIQRAVLLHVVALNFTLRHYAYLGDDEYLARVSKIDWRLRVMCELNKAQ